MDLQLTDEEKLIKETAAQFVDKELIAREGVFLKQVQPFLPPGAPERRELDAAIAAELTKKAREVGLWALELPETMGGPAMGHIAQVLIHREFGRSVLPFAPATIPAFMFETKYGQALAAGELSLALAFDEAHKTGSLSQSRTLYRQEPEGAILQDSRMDVYTPRADLFLFPAREQGTQRLGLFVIERDAPGLNIVDEGDLTSDATVARLTLRHCRIANEQLLGYEYEAGAIIASRAAAHRGPFAGHRHALPGGVHRTCEESRDFRQAAGGAPGDSMDVGRPVHRDSHDHLAHLGSGLARR